MPRACSICTHQEREAIDQALAAGEALRGIARRFAVSEDAVARHKAEHLTALLARAQARSEAHAEALGAQVAQQEAAEDAHALNVMAELQRCFTRVNLLFDACDRWLRDPADATRYDIGPRAEEIEVTYTTPGPRGLPLRRKERLSVLLTRAEGTDAGGMAIQRWETKHADPRELVIKTAAQLKAQTELLAKLLGDLAQEGTMTITLSPEWTALRTALLQALAPYPEARVAVSERLMALETTPVDREVSNGSRR